MSTASTTPTTAEEQHELIMAEFRAGVTACLRSWSALRAAINSGWGGIDSARKAEVLRNDIIYQHFDGTSFPPKDIDIWDLEDALAIYMEEEFSITLEDDSEKQVAQCIWHMYEDCSKGDVTLCRRIVQSAEAMEAQMNGVPIQVVEQEDDEMDEGDNVLADTQEIPTLTSAKDYASGSLFAMAIVKPTAPPKPVRQLGEAPPELQPKVQLDDDGFAAIPTKKKKNRAP